MKINEANLPNGWAKATIGVLADYVNGRAFKPTEWKDVGKPIIRIQNLNNNNAKYNFSPENHEEKYLVKNGDLLFAWSASLGAYIWHGEDAWLNQHIFIVHPKNCTTKLFVFYLLEKITTELYAKAHGSGMVHVTKGKFESTEISLPPLNEQHRIVAKIEELFSELDKGIENLKTAQTQLKVYRQALLKHAFEGKLTAQWRAERNVTPAKAGVQPLNDMDSRLPPAFARVTGNDEVGGGNDKPLETADTLLKRIQQKRMQHYQQQLANWEKSPSAPSQALPIFQRGKPTSTAPIHPLEKGGRGGISKPKPPKSLPPLTAEELAGLPELPEGWGWVKVGNVSSVGTGITPLKGRSDFYANGNIPWVTSGALNDNFVTEASDYVTDLALKETNLRIYPKHTLLIALYGEGKTRGKCSELLIEATTNQAIAAIVQEGVSEKLRKYMKWFFQKNYGDIRLKSSGGVQPNLNLSIIENTLFPMCSIEEANQVVDAIEMKLSEADQLDQTISTSLQQAEALRQSILKKAFSGQLMPQDPNDEPASELLACIKAERADTALRTKRKTT